MTIKIQGNTPSHEIVTGTSGDAGSFQYNQITVAPEKGNVSLSMGADAEKCHAHQVQRTIEPGTKIADRAFFASKLIGYLCALLFYSGEKQTAFMHGRQA